MSPSTPFLERSFLPLLERMGPTIVCALDRHGFYPAGGGRITVEFEPIERLGPLLLAGEGHFVTGPPTLHRTTNLDVIERFLGRRPRLEALADGRVRVVAQG